MNVIKEKKVDFLDLLLIAFALSLDAFSVSISCGIKLKKNHFIKFIKISLAFGLFQAFMPFLGWLMTNALLKDFIVAYAKWVTALVFFLLALKTFHDYYTSLNSKDDKCCDCDGYKCLTTLAIATSIDAFVVGSVLGVQDNSLMISVILIGVVTFFNSILGCLLGNRSITLLQDKSRVVSGLILLVLAIKSLL